MDSPARHRDRKLLAALGIDAQRFDTSEYVRSHMQEPGSKPLPGEYDTEGMWAFDFGHGPEFSPTMSYSKAKKWALQRAKELGLGPNDYIKVLP